MAPYLPARIAALASFVFVLVMNAVASALPLNGLSVGGVSDKYTTLFAPIDFTFGIWGLIYLGLTIYTFTHLFTDNQVIQRITPWFIFANIFNGSWIIAWRLEWLLVSCRAIVLPIQNQQGNNFQKHQHRANNNYQAPIRDLLRLGHRGNHCQHLIFLSPTGLPRRLPTRWPNLDRSNTGCCNHHWHSNSPC
jgi:hypothetical protein